LLRLRPPEVRFVGYYLLAHSRLPGLSPRRAKPEARGSSGCGAGICRPQAGLGNLTEWHFCPVARPHENPEAQPGMPPGRLLGRMNVRGPLPEDSSRHSKRTALEPRVFPAPENLEGGPFPKQVESGAFVEPHQPRESLIFPEPMPDLGRAGAIVALRRTRPRIARPWTGTQRSHLPARP
jgi:hypothetical protein